MTRFWLSFADSERPKGTQFLGVVIVDAGSFIEAVRLTHVLGLNPGGEVRGTELPDDAPPVAPRNMRRLLSREEIEWHDSNGWDKERN